MTSAVSRDLVFNAGKALTRDLEPLEKQYEDGRDGFARDLLVAVDVDLFAGYRWLLETSLVLCWVSTGG